MQCRVPRKMSAEGLPKRCYITGSFDEKYGYVTLNAGGSIITCHNECEVTTTDNGATLTVYASSSNSSAKKYSEITLNGEIVASGGSSYTFGFTDKCLINLRYGTYRDSNENNYNYYRAAITMPYTG